jgi:RNA polymerase sigma-70 factor (ECF subfamily)
MTNEPDLEASLSSRVAAVLVSNHREFLAFLQARVGNRAIAQDVLQSALVKGIEKAETIRDEERVTAWFYRLLRNALVDHYRRQATQAKVHVGDGAQPADLTDDEMLDTVCKCVNSLVTTLKPEYAAILEWVDLGEHSLDDFARDHGITPNNAAVRLHRARQALKRQLELSCGTCVTHGCLDCTCGQ